MFLLQDGCVCERLSFFSDWRLNSTIHCAVHNAASESDFLYDMGHQLNRLMFRFVHVLFFETLPEIIGKLVLTIWLLAVLCRPLLRLPQTLGAEHWFASFSINANNGLIIVIVDNLKFIRVGELC